MRILSGFRKSMLLVTIALTAAAQPAPILPTVTSYSLERTRVTLPLQLAGDSNVLVLYFQPDQSDAAVGWTTALAPFKETHPGLQTYILPIYSRENFFYRWWILASLRSGAPPAEEWKTTIPLFVDKTAFLRSLHIANEKHIIVLLTDRTGRINWRTEGPLSDPRLNALTSTIAGSSVAPTTHARLSGPILDRYVRASSPSSPH